MHWRDGHLHGHIGKVGIRDIQPEHYHKDDIDLHRVCQVCGSDIRADDMDNRRQHFHLFDLRDSGSRDLHGIHPDGWGDLIGGVHGRRCHPQWLWVSGCGWRDVSASRHALASDRDGPCIGFLRPAPSDASPSDWLDRFIGLIRSALGLASSTVWLGRGIRFLQAGGGLA
jgi:hypothetical protein